MKNRDGNDVEIIIHSNQDPSRIARLTTCKLASFAELPWYKRLWFWVTER